MTEQQETRRLHLIHCSGCSECRVWREQETLRQMYYPYAIEPVTVTDADVRRLEARGASKDVVELARRMVQRGS